MTMKKWAHKLKIIKMLGITNRRTKGAGNFEYHDMGEVLDDAVINLAGKSCVQIINDLRDAGFTGRNGKTKRGKGSDMCEVYRMECGGSTCKKVARLLHMSASDAENRDVPEFSIEYSGTHSSDCNFRDIG